MTTLSQTLKNNFYFKRVVKYCSLNLRSESELNKKLSAFEHMDREVGEERKILKKEPSLQLKYIQSKGYSYNASKKALSQFLSENINL